MTDLEKKLIEKLEEWEMFRDYHQLLLDRAQKLIETAHLTRLEATQVQFVNVQLGTLHLLRNKMPNKELWGDKYFSLDSDHRN